PWPAKAKLQLPRFKSYGVFNQIFLSGGSKVKCP
ncbi:MAG: hypothetical protein JWR73_1209, partial [Tardiphaga sp.]|nr:hypothetical protein [Tardiphaga sp.]